MEDECNDVPPSMAEDGEIVFISRDEVFLLSVVNLQLNPPLEADDATRCLDTSVLTMNTRYQWQLVSA